MNHSKQTLSSLFFQWKYILTLASEVSLTHWTTTFSSFTSPQHGSEFVVTKHASTIGTVCGIDSYFDLTVSVCLSCTNYDPLPNGPHLRSPFGRPGRCTHRDRGVRSKTNFRSREARECQSGKAQQNHLKSPCISCLHHLNSSIGSRTSEI